MLGLYCTSGAVFAAAGTYTLATQAWGHFQTTKKHVLQSWCAGSAAASHIQYAAGQHPRGSCIGNTIFHCAPAGIHSQVCCAVPRQQRALCGSLGHHCQYPGCGSMASSAPSGEQQAWQLDAAPFLHSLKARSCKIRPPRALALPVSGRSAYHAELNPQKPRNALGIPWTHAIMASAALMSRACSPLGRSCAR